MSKVRVQLKESYFTQDARDKIEDLSRTTKYRQKLEAKILLERMRSLVWWASTKNFRSFSDTLTKLVGHHSS